MKTGIYIYKFNDENGSLTTVSVTGNILNPSYLVVSPDGKYVYACTESQTPNTGSVSSFAFDHEKGRLTFINSQGSGGENPVYLTVHKSGRWLVNANYTEGSVSVYPLDTSGSIRPASQFIAFTEGSINKERQTRAHVHSAVFSPNQDYIFFPDLGADKIRCYAFDPLKTQPLQLPEQPAMATVPGSGPRHFTFHPNGRFCYCIEEMSGTVSAYSYASGKIENIQRVAAHGRKKRKNFSGADIHISPDGLFLYASIRSRENRIVIFSVDQQNGKLALTGYQSTMGDHPRNFIIDPEGKYLLVANQISGNVVVLKRDPLSGLLEKTGIEIAIPGASCLQLKDYTN